MSVQRARLRPLYIPQRKHVDFEQPPSLKGGQLSPDLQPSTPPVLADPTPKVSKVGPYLLLEQLDSSGNVQIHKVIHSETHQEFICKVMPLENYRDTLSAYWRIGSHDHVNDITQIILGSTKAYVFFARHQGDLHSYVRSRRKLREAEACALFRQVVAAVHHCHQGGVVLRDLKLRKFVFTDENKSQLTLDGLEDACVLEDEEDDALADKHGCPAYVSPEILNTLSCYSGKAADIWSLGVMLYTMLVGRYPFHDVEPAALFSKIRRGQFTIPECVSSRARCLIRSMLRRDPSARLTAEEVLHHPWLADPASPHAPANHRQARSADDQTVPDACLSSDSHQDDIFGC